MIEALLWILYGVVGLIVGSLSVRGVARWGGLTRYDADTIDYLFMTVLLFVAGFFWPVILPFIVLMRLIKPLITGLIPE